MQPNELFGHTIRLARTHIGLTMLQVAKATGVSPGYICDLEQHRRRPSSETIDRIASVLHVDRVALHRAAGILPPELAVLAIQSGPVHALLLRLKAGEISETDLALWLNTRRTEVAYG